MTVEPGRAHGAAVTEVEGPVGNGAVLVEGLAVGICGTDIEIANGHYGSAPPGAQQLVLGHESVGRVVDAPSGTGLRKGDLVVGIVRRPDPAPCGPCAAGAWDMCSNGGYTERGIRGLDGYGAQLWLVEPEFAVAVPASLGHLAVLVEPASVVAKAWDHIEHMLARAPIEARRVLITGAGPVGLLAALLGVQRGFDVHVLDQVVDGPKPELVAALGATYHTTAVAEVPEADVVVECTGVPSLVLDVIGRNSPAGIVCLTGVSTEGRNLELDVGATSRQIVLQNDVIFGSVSSNRAHYETATDALTHADPGWLAGLVTRRVALDSWTDALERDGEDVKVIVDLV